MKENFDVWKTHKEKRNNTLFARQISHIYHFLYY